MGVSLRGERATKRVVRSIVAVLAVLMVWQLAAAMHAPAALAARSAEWARFDVGVKLLTDGKLSITETQVIDFQDGPFTAGSRNIALGRIDGISNVRGAEIVDGKKLPYQQVDTFDGHRAPTRSRRHRPNC